MLVVTPIAGRLYNHMDSRLLVSIGVALMMWGYIDMSGFNLETIMGMLFILSIPCLMFMYEQGQRWSGTGSAMSPLPA